MPRKIRGLSNRLGRACEEVRFTGRGQRSDNGDGIKHGRPMSIGDGEDLVGQGAELLALTGARQPGQHDRSHRDDPLQLTAGKG